jgi:hypothetical protein
VRIAPSHGGSPADKEVENEQDDPRYEHDVKKASGNVKCEKPKQPKYDQNCGDDSEHVFVSRFRRSF